MDTDDLITAYFVMYDPDEPDELPSPPQPEPEKPHEPKGSLVVKLIILAIGLIAAVIAAR